MQKKQPDTDCLAHKKMVQNRYRSLGLKGNEGEIAKRRRVLQRERMENLSHLSIVKARQLSHFLELMASYLCSH